MAKPPLTSSYMNSLALREFTEHGVQYLSCQCSCLDGHLDDRSLPWPAPWITPHHFDPRAT